MVFYISLFLLVIFLLFGFMFPDGLLAVTNLLFSAITSNLGWLYLISVLGILIFCLFLAFSLGLVDVLGAFCGYLYRPNFKRAHG